MGSGPKKHEWDHRKVGGGGERRAEVQQANEPWGAAGDWSQEGSPGARGAGAGAGHRCASPAAPSRCSEPARQRGQGTECHPDSLLALLSSQLPRSAVSLLSLSLIVYMVPAPVLAQLHLFTSWQGGDLPITIIGYWLVMVPLLTLTKRPSPSWPPLPYSLFDTSSCLLGTSGWMVLGF